MGAIHGNEQFWFKAVLSKKSWNWKLWPSRFIVDVGNNPHNKGMNFEIGKLEM